jgi:diguanylate cyclase (GGDEF)-like protein
MTQDQQDSRTAMLQKNDLEQSLALELFQRTSATALVGLVGVGIMVYPHMTTTPWQQYVTWAIPMFLIIFARAVFGMYAVDALRADLTIKRFINVETFVCALAGISWARSVYLFDSSTMDQAFYFRLMILSSALALILPSTTVFLRHFLAYALPIAGGVLAHFLRNDYIQPRGLFLTCSVLYFGMLGALAFLTNRQLRASIANHLTVALQTDDLNEALRSERELRDAFGRSAMTDELTSIFNRRGILDNLAREIARCKRSGRPLAVLLIDVDNLNRINSAYSFGNGDRVLCNVSLSMEQVLRDSDVLGRFEGGRFLAVLPDLESQSAVVAAERLRHRVAHDQVALAGRLVHVTISTGIAFHRNEDDAEALLARADKALFMAKNGGRNRIATEVQDAESA